MSNYARFFAMSLDMLATAGFDGRFREVNPSWERVLGWTCQELTSQPFVTFVHPDDREKTIHETAQLGQPGHETVDFENRYMCKDGSFRWLVWTATADATQAMIFATARDVTNEKLSQLEHERIFEEMKAGEQARELLTRELTMFKALFDASPDFVSVADPTGELLYVNPGGLKMLGYDEFEPGHATRFLSPEVAARFDQEILGLVSQSGLWQQEGMMIHKEGAEVPVSLAIMPIRDRNGEVIGVGAMARDISEYKRLEVELRRRHAIQQDALHAMATPVIEVWDQIVSMPIVGIVDSVRAADMKEALLSTINRSKARFAIVDMTGVETVDTATADHLLKVMRSVRLLGAQGVITGIQPQVSQIMVALGVDMREVVTLRSLREGLRFCLRRLGYSIAKEEAEQLSGAPIL